MFEGGFKCVRFEEVEKAIRESVDEYGTMVSTLIGRAMRFEVAVGKELVKVWEVEGFVSDCLI